MRMRESFAVVALSVAMTAGCGGAGEPYGAVTGRVTCDGVGVPDAVVMFEPTGGGPAVTAEADGEGNYVARRSAEMPGLPPGTYRVAVMPPLYYPGLGPVGSNAPPRRDDIPLKYRDPATSGLSLTVTAATPQEWDIEM